MVMDSLGWDQVTAQNLDFLQAIGVECVRVDVPSRLADGADHTDDFRRVRTMLAEHGLELVALHARGLPKDKIVYGREGREEQLNNWIAVVRAIGAAGVPMTGLTFQPIGHFRTTRTAGYPSARSPSGCSSSRAAAARASTPGSRASSSRSKRGWWEGQVVSGRAGFPVPRKAKTPGTRSL
jgi:D-mannonate dehydratase